MWQRRWDKRKFEEIGISLLFQIRDMSFSTSGIHHTTKSICFITHNIAIKYVNALNVHNCVWIDSNVFKTLKFKRCCNWWQYWDCDKGLNMTKSSLRRNSKIGLFCVLKEWAYYFLFSPRFRVNIFSFSNLEIRLILINNNSHFKCCKTEKLLSC